MNSFLIIKQSLQAILNPDYAIYPVPSSKVRTKSVD